MSGFLLDTNIPSEILRPLPDGSVAGWLKRQANETLFVSVERWVSCAGESHCSASRVRDGQNSSNVVM